MVICYDLEFPEWSRAAALAGADLLCVPTNWPIQEWPPGEHAPQLVHAQSAALAPRLFVAVCDGVGEERGQDWAGGSGILSPEGYPAWRAAGAVANRPSSVAVVSPPLATSAPPAATTRSAIDGLTYTAP